MSQNALRVVIAEDEALIRLDLKEMLEEEGYSVVAEAADPTPTRYRMLDTIREYAIEKLQQSGETDARRRHARYFVEWCGRAARELVLREQAKWLELSSNARQLFTDKSSEYIPFDQPSFVVDAIRDVYTQSK